jgi:glycosyltransferase involved in cell wall biosynthesis
VIDRAARRAAPRLLWVNHFAVVPDMGGGTRHFEMGRELAKRGWAVTVAASDFHLHGRTYMRRTSEADRSARIETLDGVGFAWLWAAPYDKNDWRRAWNWLSFGRSLDRWANGTERPDIVMGSTPHLFAALAAWRAARRYRVPFVLEVRDLWPESLAVGSIRRGPSYWALHVLARFLYRAADRIVVLAQGVADFLARGGVAPDRIILAPNGVDVGAYTRTTRASREQLRLAYAGAHGPANGLEAVLDAAELLWDEPRVAFDLVGDGPSKAGMLERARVRGLDNIRFREPIAKSAMPALLAECDAGLMVLKNVPLFAFGVSPNKLFDYLAASLPVICNVPGEVADMVRQSGAGIQARDGSGEALADAIRKLLALSPPDRAAMGARGRTWVERERDRPTLTAHLDAALRDLLGWTA